MRAHLKIWHLWENYRHYEWCHDFSVLCQPLFLNYISNISSSTFAKPAFSLIQFVGKVIIGHWETLGGQRYIMDQATSETSDSPIKEEIFWNSWQLFKPGTEKAVWLALSKYWQVLGCSCWCFAKSQWIYWWEWFVFTPGALGQPAPPAQCLPTPPSLPAPCCG